MKEKSTASAPPLPAGQVDEGRQRRIAWLAYGGGAGALLTVLFNLAFFALSGAWQLLVVAAGSLVGVGMVAWTLRLNRRGRLDAAAWWLLGACVSALASAELAQRGLTFFLVGGGLVLIPAVGGLTLPRRWWAWLAVAGLFGLYAWLVNRFEPLPRYSVEAVAGIRVFVPLLILFLFLVVLALLIRAFRVSTIRQRLLLAFGLLAFVLTLVASGATLFLAFLTGQIETPAALWQGLLISLAVAVVAVGLALGAALLITHSIVRPLLLLAETAQQIAAGDLERTVPVEREDEVGELARAFNAMTLRLRQMVTELEERVTERTRGLQTAAEVSRATTSVLDPDRLLREVVELVRERFDLYYVGLFLLDEQQQFAVLRAGTGEAGREMIARGHRLEVGGDSMIGQCVARAEARIALDVGAEARRFDNPLLPLTRSEMALPLRSRGRILGAMTVQSEKGAAFDEADIAVMQTMADQVAVAIDNARLFASTQAALAEMEATQRRYLGQAWAEYARARAVLGLEKSGATETPLGRQTLPEVQEVLTTRQLLVVNKDGEEAASTVVAPVVLRDLPIGALGLRRRGREWSREEIRLLEMISEQFALAADNIRLLDATQRRAAQDRIIGEVSARIRETMDIDAVLKTAAREFRRILELEETEIRIGVGDWEMDGR